MTLSRQCSLVSTWECILQRVLWAAATQVIISDSVTHTIEVVHCDEWWTDYWWNITCTALGCVDIQPHPHRSWPTSRLLSSITSHVVHKPPVSTIKSSGTLHKHPTPHEYWPSSTPCLVQQTALGQQERPPQTQPTFQQPWVVWS